MSNTVKQLVLGSGIGFEDAAPHALRGVPDRWRLHAGVSSYAVQISRALGAERPA